MKEEEIIPLINGILTNAHTNRDIREDLFQDLYLYHLQLEKKFLPEAKVPLQAYMIKFLTWRMWTLVKSKYYFNVQIPEDVTDYRDDSLDMDILKEGMISLSEEDKTLVILRYFDNMSLDKLSQITGMSIEGIRKKLNKIQGRIKWEGISKEIVKNER